MLSCDLFELLLGFSLLIDSMIYVYRLPIKDLQPSSTEGSQRVHTFLQPSPPIRRTANKRECITSLSDELDSDNFSDCATTVRQGEFCPIPECHELEVIE